MTPTFTSLDESQTWCITSVKPVISSKTTKLIIWDLKQFDEFEKIIIKLKKHSQYEVVMARWSATQLPKRNTTRAARSFQESESLKLFCSSSSRFSWIDWRVGLKLRPVSGHVSSNSLTTCIKLHTHLALQKVMSWKSDALIPFRTPFLNRWTNSQRAVSNANKWWYWDKRLGGDRQDFCLKACFPYITMIMGRSNKSNYSWFTTN